jgi:MSHA pilin protein MshD
MYIEYYSFPVRKHRGFTLIELIVFIVIITVGLAGVLAGINYSIRTSANPMLMKQQVAIAESLLEEIERQPFTWCDPDDSAVSSATSYAGCTTTQQTGPQSGETRYTYGQTTPFDNVIDYSGFSMAGIRSPADNSTVITGLSSYSAAVAITQAGAALGLADNTAALRIDVTVSQPGQTALTLTGYRLRYAPNSF